MKEIEVIDKVIKKLENVYAYSTEDIVRESRKYRCDIIVNYPGTDKPFIIVETKSPDSYKEPLNNAKERVKQLLQTTDLEPVFVMLDNYHSSLCYIVDKTSSTLLRPVDEIPFRYGTGPVIKQIYKEDDIFTALNMAYESLWTDGSMQQLKAFDEINKLLLCVLYIAHGITQRKGPESCVRKVWNGLRSISSKKSLLMMHVRKLVIAAAPLLPARRLLHVSSGLLPTGVTAPKPVTTTLFNSIYFCQVDE